MIQRIQTLYLLLSVICGILLFFMPFFTLVPGELATGPDTYRFSLTGVTLINNDATTLLVRHWPLILLSSIITLIFLIAIFRYDKRLVQIRIIRIALFLLLAFAGFLVFDTLQIRRLAGPGHIFNVSAGWFLLALSALGGILAIRAIRKDENLVRSADRLR
jgi:hypothetical protein